ncbi:hypothetical protein SAMN05216404_106190 [Nitrosospira multiformis]|uniref:Uncharacterized protein n=1 Tax=Nitrosospira multiformis TaxID=1231 RepID=A0A1H8IV69_9PROT|nr:hypothetical protein [Nitrosospira multiformis]SEN72259.1 hypothetical protein SAMN05216404_106190 [Nitrosospira multiformis]
METLQDATVKICELKGENLALCSLLACLVKALPSHVQQSLPSAFEKELETARVVCMNSVVSEHVSVGLERMADAIHSLLTSQTR